MTINHQEILERLAAGFKGKRSPSQRARIVLPLLLLARLDAKLQPTKSALWAAIETGRISGPDLRAEQRSAVTRAIQVTKVPYFNTYEKSLPQVLDSAYSDRLNALVEGFSKRVRSDLIALGIKQVAKELKDADQLRTSLGVLVTVQADIAVLSDHAFGEVLLAILQLLTEATNENAADCATPTDLIALATEVLHHHGGPGPRPILRAYDPACGTGGLLLEAGRKAFQRRPGARVDLRGHEDKTAMQAIADLYLLLRTNEVYSGNLAAVDPTAPPTLVIEGDSLLKSGAELEGTFDYAVCNPPMGSAGSWGGKGHDAGKAEIKAEHEADSNGRFGAGLPKVDDSSLLFVQHVLSKLNATGRAVFFMNASPLFEGEPSASKNAQSIRLWLLQQDYLEAVIALPRNIHYNTDIVTYLWVLDKNKAPERKNTLALINSAREAETETKKTEPVYASLLTKNLNKKRFSVAAHQAAILDLYAGAWESEQDDVRIVNLDKVRFRVVTLRRPLQLRLEINEAAIAALREHKEVDERVNAKSAKARTEIATLLDWAESVGARPNLPAFLEGATKAYGRALPKGLHAALLATLGVYDIAAPPVKNDDGTFLADPNWTDSERVPWSAADPASITSTVEAYLDKEVRPYLEHEVFFSLNEVCDGCEINFNQFFYVYEPPRPLEKIDADLVTARADLDALLDELVGTASEEMEPDLARRVVQGTLFAPRLLDNPEDCGPDAVPAYDLAVAAGGFATGQDPEPLGWFAVDGARRHQGLFAARVVGHSMDRIVEDGQWCLWEHFGAFGVAGPADGDDVIVRREDEVDPDLGGFTFKRVVERRGRVELVPQSHDRSYQRLELKAGDRFIARLVRPLDWHRPRSDGAA